MLYFSLWKKLLVIGLCALGIVLAAPNAFYDLADDAAQARKEIEAQGPSPERLARAE